MEITIVPEFVKLTSQDLVNITSIHRSLLASLLQGNSIEPRKLKGPRSFLVRPGVVSFHHVSCFFDQEGRATLVPHGWVGISLVSSPTYPQH